MGKKNIGIDVRDVEEMKSSAMAIGSSGSWMCNESDELRSSGLFADGVGEAIAYDREGG